MVITLDDDLCISSCKEKDKQIILMNWSGPARLTINKILDNQESDSFDDGQPSIKILVNPNVHSRFTNRQFTSGLEEPWFHQENPE